MRKTLNDIKADYQKRSSSYWKSGNWSEKQDDSPREKNDKSGNGSATRESDEIFCKRDEKCQSKPRP